MRSKKAGLASGNKQLKYQKEKTMTTRNSQTETKKGTIDTKTVTVELRKDIHKKLKKRAKQQEVSLATLLARIIKERMDYSNIEKELDCIIDDVLFNESSIDDIETKAEDICWSVDMIKMNAIRYLEEENN